MPLLCGLIGEDSLLIQCGNSLLAKNYTIEFVISTIDSIQDWAKKNSLICIPSLNDLILTDLKKIDYLFSIVNSHILPNELIQLPRKGVINYHDSRLPKYAGLNVTTWAILNEEKVHGITWHVVNESIDAGDIVKQQVFPIDSTTTGFSLNLRCYEHALESFKELITELEQGTISFKKQDLNDRTYYGSTCLLPNLGFVDWNNFTAELIDRLSRSLTLGHYNNNIGCLKLTLNHSYLIVQQVEFSDREDQAVAPGEVLAIDEDALYISTRTKAIKLIKLRTSDGHYLSISEFVQRYGITPGFLFPSLNTEEFSDFKDVYSRALRKEKYWVNALLNVSEHPIFSPQRANKHNDLKRMTSVVKLKKYKGWTVRTKEDTVLATILIYLYRLNNYEKSSAFLLNQEFSKISHQSDHLFACLLPIIVDWSPDITLQTAVKSATKCVADMEQSGTYLTDIAARHPILDGNTSEPSVIINITGDLQSFALPTSTAIYFKLDVSRDELIVSHCFDVASQGGRLKEVLSNLTDHLSIILDHVLNSPHTPINEFCFLTNQEKNTLLLERGCGERRDLASDSIYELFERQVVRQPNAPAIVTGELAISYSQLWSMSDKIAALIRLLNLPSQSLVGIFANRSVEMLAIILGILKADCAYVPLDPKYPLLKIESIVAEANLKHIIITPNLLEKLTSSLLLNQQDLTFHATNTIFSSDEMAPTLFKKNLSVNAGVKDKLAYIMFTSGTTGVPKGVVVTQKNVINYCQWFSETTHFNDTSVIDFSSSFAFDLSIPCTIAPLVTGGTVAICDEDEKTNPRLFLKYLKQHKVTHAELTPGYLEMLLNYPYAIQQLNDLKVLLLGADVVPTSDVLAWLSLCPNHTVVNEYGPTETTVSATSYFVNEQSRLNAASVPIGRPAFNTTCYLLDKFNNLSPAGVKGELHIGGMQVTSGYLGKPELTQEKFIPSPFKASEILYKTGDLACWLPNGNLQFFGRNDLQVKIHGYRIELPEIEAVLVKIPSIHQAIVVVKKGHFKEKYLKAYLVADEKLLSSRDITTFLASYLPHYMIPEEFYITQTIPLKENEKIDFDALETQPGYYLTFDYEVDEELTEYEKICMSIWQQAFNSNEITSQDDFFDIGGDSLLALQIITQLKKHYNVDISLYYLFEYPSVSSLSIKLDELVQVKEGGICSTCV